jgi:hypothetical protein
MYLFYLGQFRSIVDKDAYPVLLSRRDLSMHLFQGIWLQRILVSIEEYRALVADHAIRRVKRAGKIQFRNTELETVLSFSWKCPG